MIVDASIRIDYINKGEAGLDRLLLTGAAWMHPHVLGEVVPGSIENRERVLKGRVLDIIDRDGLRGSGVGYTDAHLVASALITPGRPIWTRDKRLLRVAERPSASADLG